MEVFLQPIDTEHFEDTLNGTLDIDNIKSLSTKDRSELKKMFRSKTINIWGVKEGVYTYWEQAKEQIEMYSENPLCLFYQNKQFRSKGIIVKAIHNPKLGKELWGDSDWEYIYFLKDVTDLFLPIEEYREITSAKTKAVQGFTRMAQPKQRDALLKKLELYEIPTYQEVEEDLLSGKINGEYSEGERKVRKHISIERNSKVIKDAKKLFKSRNGKLFCEACNFDFESYYGSRGENYIEGHHSKPLFEYGKREKTKVEDITLLCSNCHRMVHKKREWLTLDELKLLISENA